MTRPPAPSGTGWHMIAEIDLVRLVADHAALDRLSDRLEELADRLPQRPGPREAEALCEDLRGRLGQHVVREERLFAALFTAGPSSPLCHALLDQIGRRHTTCLLQAEDVIAALQPDPVEPLLCAEAFGYMLRGFFEGCRQAMANEELAIVALGEARLTPGARRMLTERIAAG
ncbi:hemerythrin domain-containing protein [Sphingomonas sp. RB3P16]|uniref:hemerythrin domain-containing protein n=1 Tax=Parasphingomonas frigoris TaxID=3096163 RepID=UPI002FCB3067